MAEKRTSAFMPGEKSRIERRSSCGKAEQVAAASALPVLSQG